MATVTQGRPDLPVQAKRRAHPVVRWVRDGGLSKLAFFLPMLFVFGFFAWYPIVRAAIMATQYSDGIRGHAPSFVGLNNFRLVIEDDRTLTAVKNTLRFALYALIFGYPVPLIAAVLMSEVRKRKGLFSALAYVPVVVPPVVAVLLWKFFFDASEDGVFNRVANWFGLGPFPWLQDKATAMPSLVLEATWAAAGGTVIIYLAALSSINIDLYEAAGIDGAGIWRKVWHITMPQLRAVMLVTLILQIIGTAQVFLEPYLFTGGGPDDGTLTVLLLIYQYAFLNSGGGDYGNATALSIMLALVLGIMSAVYFRLTRSWSES